MSLFFWLVLAVIVYLFVKRRRRKKRVVAPPRRGVSDWIDQVLAAELARRTGVDEDLAVSALRGAPEPEIVSKIEEAVREVELKYVRTPLGDLELTVEVRFEKGLPILRTKRLDAADVPEDVRGELQRTGGSMVFRRWDFPWGR